MGANLLITVILGAVFVVLVLWVAVRLREPERREEQPRSREAEPQPAPPTPLPEFDAADVAAADVPAAEPERRQPEAPPEPEAIVAPPEAEAAPEPEAIAAPPEPATPPEPEAIAAPPEPEPPDEAHAAERSAPKEPASPAKVEVAARPAPKKKRPARKKQTAGAPRQAPPPGVATIVHEAYRNTRTWTTSLAPGRAVPAILTDPGVERGDPTTYRFKLKQRPYAFVKTDLTGDEDGGVGPLLQEKVRLLDGEGATLFEMSLLTSDIGSDETPGEITACSEGPWLDDFRELNAQSSKDSKRIGTDFRKKFRAKEQVRLKRDFGV